MRLSRYLAAILDLCKFRGFSKGVEFQYFKQFITHIYKHIDETNGLVFMFISITFPNIATLYETMEAFLPSLITENLTFVQYLFLCIFDMLLQTPCANCM